MQIQIRAKQPKYQVFETRLIDSNGVTNEKIRIRCEDGFLPASIQEVVRLGKTFDAKSMRLIHETDNRNETLKTAYEIQKQA